MRRLALIAAILLTAPAAFAGDRTLAGCGCENACPLAQTANQHRSSGGEAVLASATVRAEVARVIAKNLASI